MSDTKTTPKPGSLKAAHARINELETTLTDLYAKETTPISVFPTARLDRLEEALNKPHECPGATLRALPVARQYTGRVTMPSYGIPLPAGVGFHTYVSVRMQDDVIGDQVVPPSETDVMDMLHIEADMLHPGHIGVDLADISVLPAGWEVASEEE
jgi:hypothetical protein